MKRNVLLGFWILVFIFSFNLVSSIQFNYSINNDVHTNSLAPNGNFNYISSVTSAISNRQQDAYWEIDFDGHDLSNAVSVSLFLGAYSWYMAPNDPVGFYYCPNGFNESVMTWNNQNSITGSCDFSDSIYIWSESIPYATNGLYKEIDITDVALSDPDGVFSIRGNLTAFNPDRLTSMAFVKHEESGSFVDFVPYIEITELDCNESWVEVENSCQTDNSLFIEYISDAINCTTAYTLPSDNNTYEYCNYCSAEINLIETETCIWNGSSYVTNQTYIDDNYYSCCAITGLSSDCVVNSAPYNETTTSFCVSRISDFELDLDENIYFAPFVEDKVWAKIWLNDTTQNYTCVSYVKTLDAYNQDRKDIVQVNPDYYKNEKAYFSPASNEYEDREYFETNRGITTVYFKKDNLILDNRPYLFGVECSGSVDKIKLTSEKVGYVNWKFFNEPLTRLEWAVDETLGITMMIVLSVCAMLIIGAIWVIIKR